MSKRLHGLRHLDLNKTKVLLREFYKLHREGKQIIRRGKIVERCPKKLIGGYYDVFLTMARSSEPSLKLLKELRRARIYELTEMGQKIGKLLYEGKDLEAEKKLILLHIKRLPHLRFFLKFMVKKIRGINKGKRERGTKHPIPRLNGRLLDSIIMEDLLQTGKWASVTCNVQNIDHCIDFSIEIKWLQIRNNKYFLDARKMREECPEALTLVKPLTPGIVVDSIYDSYLEISQGRSIFIPVSELRNHVCRRLNMVETLFDKILDLLWKFNKENIKFGTGPSGLLGRPLLGDRRKVVVQIQRKPLIPKNDMQKLLASERYERY